MKNLKYTLLFVLSVFLFSSCDDAILGTEDINYVSFEMSPLNWGVAIDGSSTHEISVFTTQVTGSDRTFSVSVDTDASTAVAEAYDVPATIVVPGNSNEGTMEVTLHDVNIGAGKKLVMKLAAADGLYVGNSATVNISQICDKNEVFLDIVFDDYASECSWELAEAGGEVIAFGGGYADGLASFSQSFCLPDGSYTFTVRDLYGDGLSWPANGTVVVRKGNDVLFSAEGDFGGEATGTFTVSM